MTNFVRLFGGGLGVLIAVVLAGSAGIPPLDLSSVGGIILLAGWLGLGTAPIEGIEGPPRRHNLCRWKADSPTQ